ncbi:MULTISPECIES: DUF4235 domain-containing protein [Nocardia]|uniref:DUF4235 domain-containing protein n=1 Tax=Nocardia TaxID=1817 RepID=UPI0018943C1B|nr:MULTISPECIES: DUF4235 domain-containing protein [Nocardia]MBF6347402.1 DUF4235 domain-containing protein [Nocardia flavorosea]
MSLLYKPFGTVAGALGGIAAHAVFRQVWRRVGGEEHAPRATSRDYGWREVLMAAALQGAVFGVVKAAVDRAGAVAYQRATGHWPD